MSDRASVFARPLVLALLFVVGCATAHFARPTLTLHVVNQNWYAHTLRFDCTDGSYSFVVRGLVTGERRRIRKPLLCRSYAVGIEGVGLSYWLPHLIDVEDGIELCVEITPSVRFSTAWPCTRRTE